MKNLSLGDHFLDKGEYIRLQESYKLIDNICSLKDVEKLEPLTKDLSKWKCVVNVRGKKLKLIIYIPENFPESIPLIEVKGNISHPYIDGKFFSFQKAGIKPEGKKHIYEYILEAINKLKKHPFKRVERRTLHELELDKVKEELEKILEQLPEDVRKRIILKADLEATETVIRLLKKQFEDGLISPEDFNRMYKGYIKRMYTTRKLLELL